MNQFVITITLDQNTRQIVVQGIPVDKILAYGMLEAARQVVTDLLEGRKPPMEPPASNGLAIPSSEGIRTVTWDGKGGYRSG